MIVTVVACFKEFEVQAAVDFTSIFFPFLVQSMKDLDFHAHYLWEGLTKECYFLQVFTILVFSESLLLVI